ncbi:MAG TPA: adenosine-specific kinase [Verrucomicrobiae bacterium]|nr:adenosine-specific kinase [Verrucomicrobiae bacterium]
MELQLLKIENLPAGTQIIVAQSNFIKTVEDVAECLVNCVPGIKFGLAFCEASGPCLVRHMGNDSDLDSLATNYAFRLSAGHSLIILIKEAFPINVLPRLKEVPEIVTIYCATANPIEILYVQTEMGRAIIGIVDGFSSKGIETEEDIIERQKLLRKIGYKF